MEENKKSLTGKINKSLKKLTGHDFVELMKSGDDAVYASLYISSKLGKNKIALIPEEAGWLSYKKYPKRLGMEIKEVKCKDGLLDLDDLKLKVNKGAACLIYVNPAGYFAEQDANAVYNICKGKCLVIMDCSGSVGTKMCDGRYADMIVCSFGKWKPVNMNYGGFISFNDPRCKHDLNELKPHFDEHKLSELSGWLDDLEQRYALFNEHRIKVLTDLEEYDIVHPDRQGINVIVKFHNDDEKNKIIDYCRDNGYEYTLCPRYIRVNSPAVSIELKRLE